MLDLFAVRYVVLPEALPDGRFAPAYAGAEGVVYQNPRALPRAWVTGRWTRVAPGSACREALLASDFDRAGRVLLETPPEPAPDASATGTARITAFTANTLRVEVESTAPAVLVLAEAYHSGWRARVDDRPAPVWPADCALRAVPVPAGQSVVELRFTDPALRAGMGTSIASLVLVLVLLAADVWRRRTARAASPGAAP